MANMIPITSFFPLVKVYASEVPDPVAEQMIRLAAVEFCERTRCWRHIINRNIDAFNGGCGSPQIRVLPPYATIFQFEFAYFNGRKLESLQFSEVDVQPPESGPEFGNPDWITQSEPGTVRLLPAPDYSGVLNMSVFLKPVSSDDWHGAAYDTSEDDELNLLPDFLLSQQGEAISHGALARILAIPNQTYTDPARSEFYRMSFANKLDHRFDNNTLGQQRAQPRSKPHNF